MVKATPRALAAPWLSIGLIADTHGVLSPAVPRLFAGVNHIIHAGDIGRRTILRKLEKIAPVTAVSGNADNGRLAASLPALARGEIGGVRFLVVHKPKAVRRLLPAALREGVQLIVTGHLHEPEFYWEDGILHVNPGSATAPDEGDTQPTVAIITVLPEGLAVSFLPVPRMPLPAAKTRTKTHPGKAATAKAAGKATAAKPGDKPAASSKSTGAKPKALDAEMPPPALPIATSAETPVRGAASPVVAAEQTAPAPQPPDAAVPAPPAGDTRNPEPRDG